MKPSKLFYFLQGLQQERKNSAIMNRMLLSIKFELPPNICGAVVPQSEQSEAIVEIPPKKSLSLLLLN